MLPYVLLLFLELLSENEVFKINLCNFSFLPLAGLLLIALRLIKRVVLEQGLVVALLQQFKVFVVIDQVRDAFLLPKRVLHLQDFLLVVVDGLCLRETFGFSAFSLGCVRCRSFWAYFSLRGWLLLCALSLADCLA